MKAVATLKAMEDWRALGFVNHLLEEECSTDRVRQIIAFLAEVTLQIGGDRFMEVMNDGSSDAVHGLGWILRSCHEALAILEDIRDQERIAARSPANVSQLGGGSPTD